MQNLALVTSWFGGYNLSVIACDKFGCSLPAFVTVNVAANQPPFAVATVDVNTGVAPLTVNFDGSQSFDPEGGAVTYDWNFGDGSTAVSLQSPSHTYTIPGAYNLSGVA